MSARVLLVDDEPSWRYAIAKALVDAGFDVVAASDYLSALAIIGAEPKIDLLITDLIMPKGVNGFALGRMARLKQRDLKIIYMTGFDVPTEEAEGVVMRKPIEPEALIAQVKRALAS